MAAGGQGLIITEPQMPRITGHVSRPNGEPLIWASVVYNVVGSTGLPYIAATDAKGNFVISAMPGKYLLQVGNGSGMDSFGAGGSIGSRQPTGYQTGWYRDDKDGFTLNKNAATAVTLGAKNVSGIDVTIPNSVAITGTVTGPDGKPLAGILAQAVDPSTGIVQMTGATAADGTYAIVGLNSQSYDVQFTDPTGTFTGGYYSTHGIVDKLKKATDLKLGQDGQSGIDVKLGQTSKP